MQMFMQAYMESLYNALGVFLPLIVVNCIILGLSLIHISAAAIATIMGGEASAVEKKAVVQCQGNSEHCKPAYDLSLIHIYMCIRDRDYFARPELTVYNAIPTAEGCIGILLAERTRTLWGAEVLVLGFGPVGQALAVRLSALGAGVTVCAQRRQPHGQCLPHRPEPQHQHLRTPQGTGRCV